MTFSLSLSLSFALRKKKKYPSFIAQSIVSHAFSFISKLFWLERDLPSSNYLSFLLCFVLQCRPKKKFSMKHAFSARASSFSLLRNVKNIVVLISTNGRRQENEKKCQKKTKKKKKKKKREGRANREAIASFFL
jgi:hypothetical protein